MRVSLFQCVMFLALMAASCVRQNASESTPFMRVEPSEVSRTVGFDDTLYCFNGFSIVFLDAKQGVIDSTGRLTLEPVWDSVDFLSDDVLLLCRSGLYYLSTASGRIFAEDGSRDKLESVYQQLYEGLRAKDVLYWDKVVEQLDSLCNDCLAQPRGKNSVDLKVIEEAEALKSLLQSPSGHPDSTQIMRIDAIVERFDRYRR